MAARMYTLYVVLRVIMWLAAGIQTVYFVLSRDDPYFMLCTARDHVGDGGDLYLVPCTTRDRVGTVIVSTLYLVLRVIIYITL